MDNKDGRDFHEKVVSGRKAVALPPSPVPGLKKLGNSKQQGSSAKATGKSKKKNEPHVYSSLDLHHVHDVHVDSTAIAHTGMLSGEDSGEAFQDYEQSVLNKIGTWGKHTRRKEWGEEEFNLDTYQLRRLQQIMDRVRIRKKQDSKMANLFRAEDRKRYRMELLQELVVQADESFRVERIIQSKCSDAMRFTCVGDEHRLRQELNVGRKSLVNQRDMKMGSHTLLHEAVGRGKLAIVRMLLADFHANPNVATLMGWTSPLHLAVEKDFRQIASYLIAFGANLRATDSYGRIPFHYVQSVAVMKLLLKYPDRFDPCTKSVEGLLPSEHYDKYCNPEIKITPLVIMMEKAQDKSRFEAAKLERIEQQALYDRANGITTEFPLAISQNSSIIDSKEPHTKGIKNAYHYQKK